MPGLRDESLVAQEPSPMAGAAEGVWLDYTPDRPRPYERRDLIQLAGE
jgi:hypothetical protein